MSAELSGGSDPSEWGGEIVAPVFVTNAPGVEGQGRMSILSGRDIAEMKLLEVEKDLGIQLNGERMSALVKGRVIRAIELKLPHLPILSVTLDTRDGFVRSLGGLIDRAHNDPGEFLPCTD